MNYSISKQYDTSVSSFLYVIGPPANVKGGPPQASTYVTPGVQAGGWQYPQQPSATQPGYPSTVPPGQPFQQQQPQRVVVVVNAPNFGKTLLADHTIKYPDINKCL